MVARCNALARQALESKEVKAAFDQQGATATWMTPADTAAKRADDEKRLAPVIRESGAKVE
jgi:tripartite-type tricarboxylate transporter receptor subunit TctC